MHETLDPGVRFWVGPYIVRERRQLDECQFVRAPPPIVRFQ